MQPTERQKYDPQEFWSEMVVFTDASELHYYIISNATLLLCMAFTCN